MKILQKEEMSLNKSFIKIFVVSNVKKGHEGYVDFYEYSNA